MPYLFLAVVSIAVMGAQGDDIDSKVREELARGQLYDGEKYDRLISLGPDAIPALCDELQKYKFPNVILRVLTTHRDAQAVPSVLEFLESRRVHWDTLSSDLRTIVAIDALKEINDARAEPLLREIANRESAHREARFKAFAALARLGSSEVKYMAWEEIWRVYETGDGIATNAWPDPSILLEHDVYLGLAEVLTSETDRVLAEFISSGRPGHQLRPMIQLLGRRSETKDRPKIIAALLDLAENGNNSDEFLPRMDALFTLHAVDAGIPKERLRHIVKVLEEGFPQYVVKREIHRPDTVGTNPFFRIKDEVNVFTAPMIASADTAVGAPEPGINMQVSSESESATDTMVAIQPLRSRPPTNDAARNMSMSDAADTYSVIICSVIVVILAVLLLIVIILRQRRVV